MKASVFRRQLSAASNYAIEASRRVILNRYSSNIRYDIVPCTEDSCVGQATAVQITADEVVALLCRQGQVHVWIDISVAQSSRRRTTLTLYCADRTTAREDEMYYVDQGSHPFGIKTPVLLPWAPKERYYLFYERNPLQHLFSRLRWYWHTKRWRVY